MFEVDKSDRHLRGKMVDVSSGDVVVQGHRRPVKYSMHAFPSVQKGLFSLEMVESVTLKNRLDPTHAVFNLGREGTLLRLFFYENKWHLVSMNKNDAFTAAWGGVRSFGDLFCDALPVSFDKFTQDLDRDAIYFFLLHATQQTHITCKPCQKIWLLNVTSRVGTPKHPLLYELSHPVTGVEKMMYFRLWKTPEAVVFNLLNGGLNPQVYTGVVAHTGEGSVYFFPTLHYMSALILRQNIPSKQMCFLYYVVHGEPSLLKRMCELYPEEVAEFSRTKHAYNIYVRKLFQIYIQAYVYKNRDNTLLPHEKFLLAKLHEQYLETRNNVTIAAVRQILHKHTNTASLIWHLVFGIKEECKDSIQK